jgi:hypothetical protein
MDRPERARGLSAVDDAHRIAVVVKDVRYSSAVTRTLAGEVHVVGGAAPNGMDARILGHCDHAPAARCTLAIDGVRIRDGIGTRIGRPGLGIGRRNV